MKVTLFLTATFLRIVMGKYRIVSPTDPIEAEEGDTVTLRCRLDPPINLMNYTVDFKRDDLNKVVHSYRHGGDYIDPQMEQYRNRTTLSREDLNTGILTLHISSVHVSDSGPYKAFVPKLYASCFFTLSVDPGKVKAVHFIISMVVVIFCLSCILVLGRGSAYHCVHRLRGRRQQAPEEMANHSEMSV